MLAYNVLERKLENLKEIITITSSSNPRFIVVVPHSGLYIPQQCLRKIRYKNDEFIKDIDYYTDIIGNLKNAVVVSTQIHRSIVDLNRKRDDFGKEGVIRKINFDKQKIMKTSYPKKELEDLLKRFYDPFFYKLRYIIGKLKQREGEVIVLEIHSMSDMPCKNRVKIEKATKRPDFCVGTSKGKAADRRVILSFKEKLVELSSPFGLKVKIDEPFGGGHISSLFGKPKNNVHVIPLEVNMRLYLNKGRIQKEKIKMIKNIISKAMTHTVDSFLSVDHD